MERGEGSKWFSIVGKWRVWISLERAQGSVGRNKVDPKEGAARLMDVGVSTA